MTAIPRIDRWIWMIGVMSCAWSLAGCGSSPPTVQVEPPADPQPAPVAAEPNDPLENATAEYAQRLSQAMPQIGADSDAPTQVTQVQWLEVSPQGSGAEVGRSVRQPPAAAQTPAGSDSAAGIDIQPTAAAAEQPATLVRLVENDRAADVHQRNLVQTLRERIGADQDPQMAKALTAAMVNVLDPSTAIDPQTLAPLTPAQRDQVQRFQQLVGRLFGELAAGKSDLNPQAVTAALDDLFGPTPLTVRTFKLCKRVEGFGVYSELDGTQLLAGRDQPMILYVELDHFRIKTLDDGQYEVRLEQEVELYTDPGGLLIWRQPKVQIVDQSRNRRHDFFVVQKIVLPRQLSVGQYVLKVRISDIHGQSVDLASQTIKMVADRTLVSTERR